MIETNSLTKVSDLDTNAAYANKMKVDLDYKRTVFQRRLSNASINAQELAQEIERLRAKLASFNTVLATLPEGPEKVNLFDLIGRTQQELDAAIAEQSDSGIGGKLSRMMDTQGMGQVVQFIGEYEVVLSDLRTTLVSAG